jgi:hypothetical protein
MSGAPQPSVELQVQQRHKDFGITNKGMKINRQLRRSS